MKVSANRKQSTSNDFIKTAIIYTLDETARKVLTHVFGIPSPKDDIDGSQVAGVYWQEKDLPRIVRYCEKDVLAIAQVLLRYKGMEPIAAGNISSATNL